MRKTSNWLAATILSMAGLLFNPSLYAEFDQPMYDFELSAGYRHDNFKTSIAGGSRSPETIWSQQWDELQMYSTSANWNYTTCNNYYLRLTADYGHVYDGNSKNERFAILRFVNPCIPSVSSSCGESSDSLNGRKLIEVSEIKGNAKNGHVMDFSAVVGYQFTSNGSRCVATPYGGWSQHYQYLRMHDAVQTVNNGGRPASTGPVPGLKNKYNARWFGPVAGLSVLVEVEVPCLIFFGFAEYHWMQYRALGNWNFSDLFDMDYGDHANGRGLVASGGFNYNIGCGWYIGVVGYYRNFITGHGKHKTSSFTNTLTRDIDFGTEPIVNSRFNHAHWNSWSVEAAIDFRFWCM